MSNNNNNNNNNNTNNNENFSWLQGGPPWSDSVIMPYSRPPVGVNSGRWVLREHPVHGPASYWEWDESSNDVSIDYNITANTNNELNNMNPSHLLWQHQQPPPAPNYKNSNNNVKMPLRARAQSQTEHFDKIQNLPSYYQQYNSPSIYNPLPGRKHSIRRDFPPNYTNKSRKGKKRTNKSKRRNPSKRTTKKRKTKSRRRK
jgi:hypothetical protein